MLLTDGLAYGALPTELLQGLRLKIAALVHHPLAMETGLEKAAADRLRASERAALSVARTVITTSVVTADTLVRDFDVPPARLHVAVPGTDPAPRSTGNGATPLLLTVGTLTARKGHDVLIRALAMVADLPWSSVLVGSQTRDPAMAAMVSDLIGASSLGSRIQCSGEMEPAALAAVYDKADLFVLPSRYEGYGMVFAEALAHGLPIVACAAGAVPATVPKDAGILVPPDHPEVLAAALRRVLTQPTVRGALADAAWHHGQQLPRWSDTAAAVAGALQEAA